jgi:hypothetical protein
MVIKLLQLAEKVEVPGTLSMAHMHQRVKIDFELERNQVKPTSKQNAPCGILNTPRIL